MLKRLHLILLLSIFCFAALLTNSDRVHATIQNQSGPALGDTIDLTSWSTRDGRTLAQEMKSHSLAMILLVNPSCGTCTNAKEGFQKLRENVAQPGKQRRTRRIDFSTICLYLCHLWLKKLK